MTKKKTTLKKSPEPKARYNNGQKVFINCYCFAGPPLILEGEVKSHEATTYPILSENGKITGNETDFDYHIRTVKGEFEMPQDSVYPSFVEAAKQFAKAFVFYLK